MENEDHHTKTEMNTLVECIEKLKKQDFNQNFIATPNYTIMDNDKRLYKPSEVKIVSFYRFEGESDPADSSILYAIETNDGEKGILTDAYGSYSDSNISNFIDKITDIHKSHIQ